MMGFPIIRIVLLVLLPPLFAEADHPYEWSPSISLVESDSEPGGNGWCPDISGFRATINCDSMQAHSCKPQGSDTQFAYNDDDPELTSIYAVNFDGSCGQNGGGCMAVDGGIEAGATMKVEDCLDDSPQQRFVYTTSGYFRIGPTNSLCLGVGEDIREAGRFWARDFLLVDCDTADDALIQWEVRPMPKNVRDDDVDGMGKPMGNATNSNVVNGTAIDEDSADVDVATEKAGRERDRVLRGKVLDLINKVE